MLAHRQLLRVEGDQGVKPKRPYAVGKKSGEPFALAGIWENWQRPETDEWVRTFAIITTNSNELVRGIHDRMPVIVPPRSTTGG